jgi:hypothetical protein
MGRSTKALLLCLAGVLSAGCGQDEATALSQQQSKLILFNPTVDPARELLITDVSVVEDPVRTVYVKGVGSGPQGAWTFGRLMEQLSGGQDVSQFTLAWLAKWEQDQVVNGFTAPARPLIRSIVTDPWLVASGCAAGATVCDLDFSQAPFRLTAIVNRIDKRDMPDANGRVSDAGEGRFVFNFINAGVPANFTVIFEFQLAASSSVGVMLWANWWHFLGTQPFGPTYNAVLQTITDGFSRANPFNGRPNGSYLDALRTNEVTLAEVGSDPTNGTVQKLWEIRSFAIGQDGQLFQNIVAQTPALSFAGSPQLASWLNANAASILSDNYQVPAAWLDARAPTPSALSWATPGVNDPAVLSHFAINTCSGCHRSETATGFVHVGKRNLGQPVKLSTWLTTIEIPRRVTDFLDVLTFPDLSTTPNTLPARLTRGH